MKLINMLIFFFIVQMTISFYYQLYDDSSTSDYLISSYNENETKIWDFVKDPSAWNSTPLVIALLALGTASAAFIVIGIFTSTPSDTALFSPVFILLLGAGLIPILSLYKVITNDPTLFGCPAMPCIPALFVWGVIGGLLSLMYIASIVEWWSSRSVG